MSTLLCLLFVLLSGPVKSGVFSYFTGYRDNDAADYDEGHNAVNPKQTTSSFPAVCCSYHRHWDAFRIVAYTHLTIPATLTRAGLQMR